MRRWGLRNALSLRRPLAVASAVAVALLTLAACGSGSGGGSGTQRATSQPRSEPPGSEVERPGAQRRKVRVPPVTGLRTPLARRRLHRRGLSLTSAHYPGTLGNPNYPGNCEIVTSQAPGAGAKVPRGSTINAVLGICKGQIRKPATG